MIDFGLIDLCIGADITWCSKGFAFDDNDSRKCPVIHFFVNHLNIEHLFKNIHRFKTKLNQE